MQTSPSLRILSTAFLVWCLVGRSLFEQKGSKGVVFGFSTFTGDKKGLQGLGSLSLEKFSTLFKTGLNAGAEVHVFPNTKSECLVSW